jgi:SAM-dependent methyltransferase
MNLLVDMDGVICTEERTFERALAKPIPGAREAIALLREQGHQVVIYTARSWSELAMTKNWLKENGIEIDGIHMGKPVADKIIDDRAIHFNGWPAAIEAISKNSKPDIDQVYLKILREATSTFLWEIFDHTGLKGPVLEVGPMTRQGLNSPIYQTHPETYVDTRIEISKKGFEYLSLDIDPTASPDICCDLMNILDHVEKNSIGSIILMSCLEHMPRLFEVPKVLYEVLQPGGLIFALTPWNLRFHGPRPDCWRISDDGYKALFGKHFNLVEVEKIACPGRPLSPVGLKVILQK